MLVALTALLLAPWVVAGDPESSVPAMILTVDGDPQEVNRHIGWLADADGTLSLADVRKRPEAFQANPRDMLNPGMSDAIVWVRLKVVNPGADTGTWVLSLDRVLLETGELWFADDEHVAQLLENNPASFARSYRAFGTLAGRFALAPGASGELFIRYRGANYSGLRMGLYSEASYAMAQLMNTAVFFAVLGGVLTLVVYSAVTFMFLGAWIVLLYVVAQLAFFAFFAHLQGFTTIYLWPDSPGFGRVFSPLSMITYVIASVLFARLFFVTRERAPWLDRLLLGCATVGAVAAVLSPLDYLWPEFDRRIPLVLVYLVSIAGWLTLPVLAGVATWRWRREYWPLLVAWSLMAFYLISLMLHFLGVLAEIPFGERSYAMVFVEALFLAFALALRVRSLRREAIASEVRLGESLRLQLEATARAGRLLEERQWAMQDLAEKGRLLLAAGHDTRQALSALRNYAAGLRRGGAETELPAVAGQMEQIADYLNEVLTTAVEGSRSGGMSDSLLAVDTLSVNDIFNPLRMIFAQEASKNDLTLRLRHSDLSIASDRVLIVRILGNLISNAIKYTEQGTVLVTCRPYQGGLRFQVWDQGVGIDAVNLQRLLNPGTGALRLDADAVDGSGAGFGINHNLAARIGGRIEGRSLPGRGSLFELSLPAPVVPEDALQRVLLLDDDRRQRAVSALALRHLCPAAVVSEQMTIERWLQRAGASERRLLVLDQHFDGVEAVIEYLHKARAQGLGLQVIVTTYDRSIEVRTRLTDFTDLILYKPVSEQALASAVHWLGNH